MNATPSNSESILETPFGSGQLAPPPPDAGLKRSTPAGYRLLKFLGRGGMGEVWAAEDLGLHRTVALKFLTPHLCDAQLRARFQVEAEATARLRHPHIVQILAIGEHNNTPFLVLEFVAGSSLAARLASGPLPARVAAELVRTLADAVQAAHSAGIVHRDLKPANVLLTDMESWTPKLTDFGLAKLLDTPGLTHSGAILGTPTSMAPEQALALPNIGSSVDIWALGIVLYECLTGRPPFLAGSAVETLELVRLTDPVPPRRVRPALPRDLETICLKCLSKVPSQRYGSARELADDLGRFLDGRPVLARPVGPLARALKWARRQPGWAACIALAGFASLAGGIGLAMHEHRLRNERETAQANYREARDAIWRMLARLDERHLRTQPRLQNLARAQSEEALAFFLASARTQDNHEDVRADVARASFEVGFIRQSLGDWADAETDLRRAESLFAALKRDFPNTPAYHDSEIRAATSLGQALLNQGRFAEAETQLQSAVKRGHERLLQCPSSPTALVGFGAASVTLSRFLIIQNRSSDALAPLDGAMSVLAEPATRSEAGRDLRATWGNILLNLAEAVSADPARQGQQSHYRQQACAIWDRLAEEDPDDDNAIHNSAAARINLSYSEPEHGDYWLTRLRESARNLDTLLSRTPEMPSLRAMGCNAHGRCAQILRSFSRYNEELGHRRRIVELTTGNEVDHHRLFLAETLALVGDHQQAMNEVEAIADRPAHASGLHQYVLAQICSVGITGLARDRKIMSAERENRARLYAELAVKRLRAMRQIEGEAAWRQRVVMMMRDPKFWPLLLRREYQSFAAGQG